MKINLDKKFAKKLQKRFEKYEFEVGILEDKEHLEAKSTSLLGTPDLKVYAGGPARKVTRSPSGKTIGEIFVDNMKRLNINLLSEPFQNKNAPLLKFTKAFFNLAFGRGTDNQVTNLLQAVVRNPILEGKYGPNKARTADNKGFDRHLIDTAQMFKAIKAKLHMRGGRV